jgi:hypothetical protein
MGRAWYLVVLIVLCSLSVGCTSLTPQGSSVRITSNPDVIKGCEYIGEVKGSDRMGGGWSGQGLAESNAHKRIKNNAAAMGADTVLLVTDQTGFSGSVKRGEAYKCGAQGK